MGTTTSEYTLKRHQMRRLRNGLQATLAVLFFLTASILSRGIPETHAAESGESPASPASAATVGLEFLPSPARLPTGNSITLDLWVRDVPALAGEGLYLRFDPTLLQVVDADPVTPGVQIALGSFFTPNYTQINSVDNAAGLISLACTRLYAPYPSGSGILAHITFQAVGAGTAQVAFRTTPPEATELTAPDGLQYALTLTNGIVEVVAPAPTATPTPVATNTPTPSATPTATATPASTATPTSTATATATATETPGPSLTPSDTPTATATPTDTATPTETATPTDTATPTATPTPTVTLTPTEGPSPTPSDTPTPTETPTETPEPSPTPTATETATPTETSTPTETPTPTQTPTETPTPTETATPSATPTATASPTPTCTATPTATFTPRPTVTVGPTPTASCSNAVANSSFESCSVKPWTFGGLAEIYRRKGYTGTASAWLGGYYNVDDHLWQRVIVDPHTVLAAFSYRYFVQTQETGPAADHLIVELCNEQGEVLATLDTRSNVDADGLWHVSPPVELAPYAGRTVLLHFRGTGDEARITNFFIDDVVLDVCALPVVLPYTASRINLPAVLGQPLFCGP